MYVHVRARHSGLHVRDSASRALVHARIHPMVDVAGGSLLTFRQLHAVTLAESLAPSI